MIQTSDPWNCKDNASVQCYAATFMIICYSCTRRPTQVLDGIITIHAPKSKNKGRFFIQVSEGVGKGLADSEFGHGCSLACYRYLGTGAATEFAECQGLLQPLGTYSAGQIKTEGFQFNSPSSTMIIISIIRSTRIAVCA